MNRRHQSIGIKQEIRLAAMRHAAQMQLVGITPEAMRAQIDAALANPEAGGAYAGRSAGTREFAVNNLMHCWHPEEAGLLALRDGILQRLEQSGTGIAPLWALISAVYPFWFQSARRMGRLFSLQPRVTQVQLISRLKEFYGDREMVSRHARFVVRSFVDWGVINDSSSAGSYSAAAAQPISDEETVLLFESALLAQPDGSAALDTLRHEPAFFPFALPLLSGEQIAALNPRLTVMRYGLTEDVVRLKG
jgi:hypothetical protein